MVLLRSDGRFAEGYCVANDFEQAQSRVFTVIRRIVEVSPLLKHEARITADRITLPCARCQHHGDCVRRGVVRPAATRRSRCFDELWGYTSERSRRLWDEMITSPARKISCRLTTTYAGFSGESVLLEELHKRGMALPDEVGPSLRAGDGMLFAWHTEPVAPWQDERWLAEMRRSLRPSCLCAHDPERVRVAGEQVCRSGRVGRLRAAIAGAGAAGQIACRSGLVSMPRPSATAPRWWR